MANEASTMLTVDLTDLGAAILEELRTKIEKETGKQPSKVQVIRDSLMSQYALDLWREPDRILALYEEQYGLDGTQPKGAEPALKNPTKKGHRKATPKDHELVDVYVKTYSLPNKKGVFWPPFLRAVGERVSEGYTYEDLARMIECSPDEDWIAKEYPLDKKPPLHVLFSEKVFARLVMLASQREETSDDENTALIAIRRDQHMREIKHRMGAIRAGEFYRLAIGITTVKELDELRMEIYDKYAKTPEQMAAEMNAKIEAEKEGNIEVLEEKAHESREAQEAVMKKMLRGRSSDLV